MPRLYMKILLASQFFEKSYSRFYEYPWTIERKHKVPPPYSRADDCARSLYGRRDDDS